MFTVAVERGLIGFIRNSIYLNVVLLTSFIVLDKFKSSNFSLSIVILFRIEENYEIFTGWVNLNLMIAASLS